MMDTAEQSAELKQKLKHVTLTPELAAQAAVHVLEADESYFEVIDGLDTCASDSWVMAQMLRRTPV